MKKSILIIDDYGPSAEACGEILEALGYSYVWIASPSEAIESVNLHSRFSHVIVDFDFNSAEYTGEKVGEILRRNFELMPLILLSAWIGDEDIAQQYGRVGWDALIPKNPSGKSGTIDSLLTRKLEESVAQTESRIEKNYPVTRQQFKGVVRRLTALERAFNVNGGKSRGTCSEKEALQVACIFLSKKGKKSLTESDVSDLASFRSPRTLKADKKNMWKAKGVTMTTPNAWYIYFQKREEAPGDKIGRLTKEGICVRKVLMRYPHLWKKSRSQFKQIKNLIDDYGIPS